jgi:hypothetical protein
LRHVAAALTAGKSEPLAFKFATRTKIAVAVCIIASALICGLVTLDHDHYRITQAAQPLVNARAVLYLPQTKDNSIWLDANPSNDTVPAGVADLMCGALSGHLSQTYTVLVRLHSVVLAQCDIGKHNEPLRAS